MRGIWDNGRCLRDHDITIPENVYYSRDTSSSKTANRRRCAVCAKERDRTRRDPRARNVLRNAPLVCKWCGITFTSSIGLRQQYCTPEHANQAKLKSNRERDARRRDLHAQDYHSLCHKDCGKKIPNVLPPEELARLRVMVGFDPKKDYSHD